VTPLRCLLSYAFFRNVDLAELVMELRALYGGPVEVFADSGAFSVANVGATVHLKDYAAWLEEWSQVITTAATLDVIGDPDATHRNTEALLSAGLTVLPTFHVGSPWSELERLCKAYPYLALGGMVPYAKYSDEVLRWLIRCFRIGAEQGTVFHGFGQTKVATLAALPFYSVDSSAWGAGSRFGQLPLWDERKARIVQVQVSHPAQARRYATLMRSHGADPALVGRPGFAQSPHRTPKQHAVETQMMRGAPAVAFYRLGQWLAKRHQVPAPLGWEHPGTVLFLADANPARFKQAARALRIERDNAPGGVV
jgi:hypothetical protein